MVVEFKLGVCTHVRLYVVCVQHLVMIAMTKEHPQGIVWHINRPAIQELYILVWRSHDPLPKHRMGERVWCQPYTLICTTTTRFLQANEISRHLISANARAKGTLITLSPNSTRCDNAL